MTLCKKITLLLLVLFLLPNAVFAAGLIDLDRTASLDISAQFGDLSVENMEFSLYRVSDIDQTGALTPTDRFSAYGQLLDIQGKNDALWQSAAQTLENEIQQQYLLPDLTGMTDGTGIVHFSDLPLGLYLVLCGGAVADGYVYRTAPFFVLLPEQTTDNTWNTSLTAAPKLSREPVLADFEVIKVWRDSCHTSQRPASITVHLLCDGALYDTVTLPVNGRWQYTWKNLDTNHTWSVTEDEVDGYAQPDIVQNGFTFTITNTCNKPSEATKPNLPQTGQLWWPVPVLALSGSLLFVIGLIRRRGDADA